jgi:hypothetical protein
MERRILAEVGDTIEHSGEAESHGLGRHEGGHLRQPRGRDAGHGNLRRVTNSRTTSRQGSPGIDAITDAAIAP